MEIVNKINVIGGAIIAALSMIFGEHWMLFAGFLALNIVDWATGCYKAWILHESSSEVGAKGALKKVMYWLIIALAFGISLLLIDAGKTIGLDLRFVEYFGWLTLATYIVNEFRSILENLVQAGIEVPGFLTKGLEITKKLVSEKADSQLPKEKEE